MVLFVCHLILSDIKFRFFQAVLTENSEFKTRNNPDKTTENIIKMGLLPTQSIFIRRQVPLLLYVGTGQTFS